MNEAPIHPRRLVICADDYAISPAVSAGIRELAVAGRLSATGAMTCMASWPADAPLLKPLGERVAVGLHFTLTDQAPLGLMPRLAPAGRLPAVGQLIAQGLRGRLPEDEVAAELDRQLDAFEAHFGRPPDFLDGHQHVHLFPGVRRGVLRAFGRRLSAATCWLRDCGDRPAALLARGNALKAGFIAALGRSLAVAAQSRGIRMNRGFSGFYDYRRQTLGDALPRLLTGAGDGHLLMVHPGHVDDALAACDPLTAPRQAEWSVLMADELPGILADRGFTIAQRGIPG